MIIHDPKKSVTTIIASLSPEKEAKEADDSSLGIAQDILDAVKSGDVHDLAMALKAFHAECQGYEDESSEIE